MTDLDTAIIGAGPYGLSVAAHLRARGLAFQLFGTPLESWRTFMPEGMLLKSERFASNLWDPAGRFALKRYSKEMNLPFKPVGDPLPLKSFLDYAGWFQDRAGLASLDTRVTNVSRTKGGFRLTLADKSSLVSRQVILATGHMPFRVIPAQLNDISEPMLMHSTRIGNIKAYSGRHITIIGAGQSALETAALLHEAGAQVLVLVQKNRIDWNPPSRQRHIIRRIISPDAGIGSGYSATALSELPRLFRACFSADKRHSFVDRSYKSAGSWWLRDRLENKVEFRLETTIDRAQTNGDKLIFLAEGPQGRTEHLTDRIIAATGFKVNIDKLDYLDPSILTSIRREGVGIPALSPNFETSIPGLFVIGAASSPVFGPIMRFMYGAKHVGPILTRRLSGG